MMLLLVITGCSLAGKKTIKSRAALMDYIKDPANGVQKTDSVRELEVVLTYRPWQLTAFTGEDFNVKNRKAMPAVAENELSFVLSLSANHKEVLRQLQFSQYSELVQVLAFRMKEFIEAIPDNGNPVEPIECLFQQTYGLSTANNLLVVFDRRRLINATSLRLRVKDFGLNTGEMNFKMNISDIKNIPVSGMN
ncbi:MAG: hypothetical protein JWR09_3158 [Mucilaginibacter sp.]|nr:hypothetical protein [Mucilaginibacter sp.]